MLMSRPAHSSCPVPLFSVASSVRWLESTSTPSRITQSPHDVPLELSMINPNCPRSGFLFDVSQSSVDGPDDDLTAVRDRVREREGLDLSRVPEALSATRSSRRCRGDAVVLSRLAVLVVGFRTQDDDSGGRLGSRGRESQCLDARCRPHQSSGPASHGAALDEIASREPALFGCSVVVTHWCPPNRRALTADVGAGRSHHLLAPPLVTEVTERGSSHPSPSNHTKWLAISILPPGVARAQVVDVRASGGPGGPPWSAADPERPPRRAARP